MSPLPNFVWGSRSERSYAPGGGRVTKQIKLAALGPLPNLASARFDLPHAARGGG